MERYYWILVGVFLLNPNSGFAQEPRTEIGAITTALRHARASIPAGSEVKFEIRSDAEIRSGAPERRKGEFDSARSEAIRSAVSGMDVGRRQEILVCKNRPDTCRLGVDHLLSITSVSPRSDAEAYDVLVEIRESNPQNERQPVQLKRLLITVEYSAGRWAAVSQRVVSIS